MRTSAKDCRTRALGALVVLLAVSGCAPQGARAPAGAADSTAGATRAFPPGPAPGNLMTEAYVRAVGRMAYVWGWPIVNTHNRRSAMAGLPEPGLNGGVLPVAPVGRITMLSDYIAPNQRFVTCTNQDVVYGSGFFALDDGPVVFQVPDFGERFWIYALYDARTEEFGEFGKQYGTKPGFYLLVGPKWNGEKPAGIEAVVRSSTELVNAAPRVYRDDTPEDLAAVRALIGGIDFYPLAEFDGKVKTRDWSKLPHFPAPPGGGGEMKWVDPDRYFEQLPGIMEKVPPLPGEEALYAWIRSVLDAAAKDPALMQALRDEAHAAERELVAPMFRWKHNGSPAGNGWNSPTNGAVWGTDYLNRMGTAKSNIYDNRPTETKYIYTDDDASGAQLRGSSLYAITFPAGQTPPVRGFWSMTLYDEHHFFFENPLDRYSLGTKSKSLVPNPDGSLTLYAGARSPGKDKESNWLPAPTGPFSLYIRAYWPDQAILDGTWTPPRVEKVGG